MPKLIDGAVNGAGAVRQHERRITPASPDRIGAGIRGVSDLGVLLVLGFYLWRLSQGASF